MIKADFRPLEYIEVEQNKPLVIKLNDRFIFKTHLQRADLFINFNTNKNIILEELDKLNEMDGNDLTVQVAKIACFQKLIHLLYGISFEFYGYFKRKKYYKFLNKYLIENTDILMDVLKKVLLFNSDLKKKLQEVQNIDIFKGSVSDMTAGGQSLKDLIVVDPNTGEKHFKH